MVIFGKDERAKFEADRESYSDKVQAVYDNAQTYRDGKWILFEHEDTTMFDDFLKLLRIKENRTGHRKLAFADKRRIV